MSLELDILRAVHARTISRNIVKPHTLRSLERDLSVPLERLQFVCRHLAGMNRVVLSIEATAHRVRAAEWYTSEVKVTAGEKLRARLAELEEREHVDVQASAP